MDAPSLIEADDSLVIDHCMCRYRNEKRTLLLVETSDIASIDEITMVDAFHGAFASWPEILEELWFVQNLAPPNINVHDLRRGQSYIFDSIDSTIVFRNDETCCVRYPGVALQKR